jgi:hypothetical protein
MRLTFRYRRTRESASISAWFEKRPSLIIDGQAIIKYSRIGAGHKRALLLYTRFLHNSIQER